MENKNYTTWENQYIIKMANFLRNNNISLYDEKGKYRGLDEILKDVMEVETSKFENS